jgi:NADPH2:quinone reductase
MRALQVTRHGSPGEVLAVADVEVPEPGAGEVRIRVLAAALNFNDIARCRGQLVSVAQDPPFTLGMDVCASSMPPDRRRALDRRLVVADNRRARSAASPRGPWRRGRIPAPPSLDDAGRQRFCRSTRRTSRCSGGRAQAGETLLVHAGRVAWALRRPARGGIGRVPPR